MSKILVTKRDLLFVERFFREHKKVINEEGQFTKKEILKFLNEWKNEENKIDSSGTVNTIKNERKYNKFAKYILNRNIANYDTMVLLTGPKGTGKSSTGITLIRSWCKLIGINFNPRRHIAYNNADIMDRIKKLNKFEPLLADEAIRFASAEDWNKSENKELKKLLGEIRTKHLFFILCFPLKPAKLEKTYLESYVNYWIELYTRGEGALFIKEGNPSKEAWNLKAFEKMGSWTEFSTTSEIKNKLMKHPNFWQIIKFPKVPEDVYTKYLEVRESNVYNRDEVKSAMNETDIHKSLLILMLKEIITKDGSLTYTRILKAIEVLYGIQISKQQLQALIQDAENMVEVMK